MDEVNTALQATSKMRVTASEGTLRSNRSESQSMSACTHALLERGAPSRIEICASKAIKERTKYGIVGRIETLASKQHQWPFRS